MRPSKVLLAVGIFLAVVFAAAASGEKEESAAQAQAPLEITWMGLNPFRVPMKEGTDTQKYLEQKFNVKIKVPSVDQFTVDQWNLFWASGNTADYVFNLGAETRGIPLINQGLLRPIPEDVLRSYMPTWLKKVETLVDPSVIYREVKFDGKIYLVPFANYSLAMTYIAAYRRDWADTVGIAKAPETIDELGEMLKRFSLNDPDGNGKRDTYGLEPEPWNRFNYVFGAYGTNYNSFYADASGNVFFTPASEDFKNALKKLAEWHAAGYIDPEFVTDQRPTVWNKFGDSRIGVVFDHPTYFTSTATTGPVGLLKAKRADARVDFFAAIKGPDGRSGAMRGFPRSITNSIGFGAKTSDEAMKRIMTMMETLCTDWDHYLRVQYGIEGKTFAVADGVPMLSGDYTKPDMMAEAGVGQFFGAIPVTMDDFLTKLSSPADRRVYEISFNNKSAYWGVSFLAFGTNAAYTRSSADLTKISDEMYYNAISGKVNIDSEWPNYVKRLESAGLKDVLAEYTDMYRKAKM